MRIAIEFDVDRNEVALLSEVADGSCVESCINFTTKTADAVTVYFEQNGSTVEKVLSVEQCTACFVLPDATIRAPGEFTVYSSGCMRLPFVVSQAIPAGVEYSISLRRGVFYVEYAASGGDDWIRPKITLERLSNGVLITVTDADGTQTAMVYDGVCTCDGGDGGASYSFYINADGHLICSSKSEDIPFTIDESGHLIYTYADGTEAMLLSINENGHLIHTTEA